MFCNKSCTVHYTINVISMAGADVVRTITSIITSNFNVKVGAGFRLDEGITCFTFWNERHNSGECLSRLHGGEGCCKCGVT